MATDDDKPSRTKIGQFFRVRTVRAAEASDPRPDRHTKTAARIPTAQGSATVYLPFNTAQAPSRTPVHSSPCSSAELHRATEILGRQPSRIPEQS